MPPQRPRFNGDGLLVLGSGGPFLNVRRASSAFLITLPSPDLRSSRARSTALPEREIEHGHPHAKPSDVGRVARDCGAGRMLSHVVSELEDELEAALRGSAAYRGPMIVAQDLMRLSITADPR